MIKTIEWIDGIIYKVNRWDNNLFNIIFHANINYFKPGQFGRINIKKNNKNIIRAYSYINDFNNKNLEFYIKKINYGDVSNVLYNLKNKDVIKISKKSFGNLIIDNIKEKCNTLWMIATGTGIGPYISILNSKNNFKKIKNFIVIYSIKYFKNLNYKNILNNISKKFKNRIKIIIITTKEKNINSYNIRIPEILDNKIIKKILNTEINNKNDYFMLCGNPLMIDNTKKFLINNNKICKNKILFEKYWK